MGRIHILFAYSSENKGNVCRIATQVYIAGPLKVASRKNPQEYLEKELSHHHLNLTECLQFCFQSSVEEPADSNLTTFSTTAACKI